MRAIPRGFVRAYSDVDPSAPRLVGRVLATTHEDVPWHRVVRADGSVPKGAQQVELLRRERVPMPATGSTCPARATRPRRLAPPRPRASLAAGIAAVAEADPVMAALVTTAGPIRHRPRDPAGHFAALVRSIVFQQLAGRAATAIHGRVRALVHGPLDAARRSRG